MSSNGGFISHLIYLVQLSYLGKMAKPTNGLLPQIADFLHATTLNVKCKFVTTLFYLFIIQLPISKEHNKSYCRR